MNPLTVTRHESEHGRWELAGREPCPFLAAHVVGTCRGYAEASPKPVRRREVPVGQIVLVVNIGDGFEVESTRAGGATTALPRSFVAGLHAHAVIVASSGSACCLQADLAPPAARRLLGLPLGQLADRVVPLVDLIGAEAGRLEERLDDARDWRARLDLLEGWLCRRLGSSRPVPAAVDHGWRRLVRSAGRIPIAEIQRETGWSRRHLVAQFREHVGAAPKLAARILRFERAVSLLDDAETPGWAEIAAACGYSDQAHLAHDVRELAGMTPGELRRRSLPDGVGITVG